MPPPVEDAADNGTPGAPTGAVQAAPAPATATVVVTAGEKIRAMMIRRQRGGMLRRRRRR